MKGNKKIEKQLKKEEFRQGSKEGGVRKREKAQEWKRSEVNILQDKNTTKGEGVASIRSDAYTKKQGKMDKRGIGGKNARYGSQTEGDVGRPRWDGSLRGPSVENRQ